MTIEARLARLEAAEDVRNLKARYCELCDSGYPAGELVALFTEDGVWDGGEQLGRHQGRTAIRSFFAAMPTVLSFAIHHVTNPQISVSNDALSATGRWYLWQLGTNAQDGRGLWLAATYEDEYVREGDDWRFKAVVLKQRFLASYERGWARGGRAGALSGRRAAGPGERRA